MSQNAVKILEIPISKQPKNEILEELRKYLEDRVKNPRKTGKNLLIFTPNTEQLVMATKNTRFRDVLQKADISLPDTISMVWTSQLLNGQGPHHAIPGVEFMEDLIQLAQICHVPIGLIGGRDNLAIDTLNCLREKYNLLQDSWAMDGPEIDGEKLPDELYFQRLGRKIIREGTSIVFVALGPPKQEYFIERLAQEVHGVILMAVGGSFSMISGRLPRAPQWMRSLGLEWLWRLILEPWRIKRQLALLEFVWLVLREKYIH